MSFTVEPWDIIPGDVKLERLALTCLPAHGFTNVKLMMGDKELDSAVFEESLTVEALTVQFEANDQLFPNGEPTELSLLVDVEEGTGDFISACAIDNMEFLNVESETIYASNYQAINFGGTDRLVYVEDLSAENRMENFNIFYEDVTPMNLGLGTKDNVLMHFSVNASEDINLQDMFLYCSTAGIITDMRLEVSGTDGGDPLVIGTTVLQNNEYTNAPEYTSSKRAVFANLNQVTGLGAGREFVLYGDTSNYYSYLPDTVTDCSVIDIMATEVVAGTDEFVPAELVVVEEMSFSDVDETHPNYEAIKFLFDAGYVEGYGNGTYQPEMNINRAELLKILVEAVMGTPAADLYNNCFSDVGTEWYAKYVCRAKALGWISGYPDGSFKPKNSVNNVEALKMVIEVTNIGVSPVEGQPVEEVMSGDEWYTVYVNKAYQTGLLSESSPEYSFVPGEFSTRGEVSEYMFRAYEWLGEHM